MEEFGKHLEVIKQNDPEMRIINLTGGEPTLHPQIREIIRMCHDAEIHRVTISTHGLTFIKDEALLAELAALNARIVLSFNSFKEDVNAKLIGVDLYAKKLKVLEQLEKIYLDTTLIRVIGEGLNAGELGALVRLVLSKDFIRSLEIHTMCFTGQSGTTFNPVARITVPDVLRYIEEQTDGNLRMSDFTPSPCAHPLCYQTAYMLKSDEDDYIPFARFMSKTRIRELLTDNLYMEPGEKMENALRDTINEIWGQEETDYDGEKVMRSIKKNPERYIFLRQHALS